MDCARNGTYILLILYLLSIREYRNTSGPYSGTYRINCTKKKIPMVTLKMSNVVSLSLFLWLSVDLRTMPVGEAARILAVETVAGKSHWYFMSSLLRSLTDAGHTVIVFTPFPDGDRVNYTEVDTSRDFPMKLDMDVMKTMRDYSDPFKLTNLMSKQARYYCDAVYGNQKLADVMAPRTRDRYDLLLIEPLGFDCVSYLADALGLPVIYSIPSPMITFAERLFTGEVSNPASVSNMLASHAVPGTFVQRFTNTALLTYSMVKTKYDQLVTLYTNPRPYDLAPTVNPSIIFQNGHYISESSRPVTPNVIYVGGIHLKPTKTIPKDILDFIEDSPQGVIFFTFGSTIKVSSLPGHIEQSFKEALANVPQRVLWKYEGEMKDKPKNVMTRKWFPQRDILLHPKVKLFISHGGMSGVYEAVDGGVPVLGFPVFYDQPRNIENLVLNGMAISMDLLSTTKEKLSNAISELINDEKYAKNAKIASNIFKDRPITPQQSVVYWTEYVIRHKGAPHLKSHALNLTWYQYLLLDIIAVALIFVLLITFVVFKVFKCIKTFTKDKVKTQ
ncbi:UDP-glucosyltransferase 2-like isoform X1 [Metopolophium dirhodum]|uniref:UDP-glucosyltransferase 2-like isoform X1 n=2 Tax=Metopolophium dirhodum TaxID=44670 RepID=UPI00298FB1AC|nr:UDP-glucosyltransferase 2-like isoform X1 [Metopolophium dirhodum]